jgi:hypothetical protein
MVPVGLLVWAVFSPGPMDWRMDVMLLCSAVSGLLLLNAIGVWVTLYNPRRGNYTSAVGNDLSLGGNTVLIGGMLTAIIMPQVFYSGFRPAVSPEFWWWILPLPLVAAGIYVATLKAAGPIFAARREKILAIVEGKA